MNLILQRNEVRVDGIFGYLFTEEYKFLMLTLERAYPTASGKLTSKIKAGVYNCVRGPHILSGMESHFETFEVMGVKGHSGILFHSANYDYELNGCIAVGIGYGTRADGGQMITHSKKAFAQFMDLQKDVNEFKLIVEGSSLGGTGKGKEFVKNLEEAKSRAINIKLNNSINI